MWLKRIKRVLTAEERAELDEYRRRYGPLTPQTKHVEQVTEQTKHVPRPPRTKRQGGG